MIKRSDASPKSNLNENFKPKKRYFVAMLRLVTIYALFWKSLGKKVLFWSKTVFLGQEVHYYMVFIAYHTE